MRANHKGSGVAGDGLSENVHLPAFDKLVGEFHPKYVSGEVRILTREHSPRLEVDQALRFSKRLSEIVSHLSA